ncbi:MAG TPA: sigma-54-dependent Fis family transcriptional regulator [Kofleriaceae bacterium]|nr:sigma-54-dependent Fis family transcriptional regulator [Kofleriaceae bacterium]
MSATVRQVKADDASRRAEQPSVLLALSSLLGAAVDVDRLLARLVDLIRQAMDADRATLFLVDRERDQLYSRAAHLPELDEIRLPIGRGIAGHVARTGETVMVPSARSDQRFFEEVDTHTGYETRTLLAVPVFGRERDPRVVVGVIEVLNKRSAPTFDEGDRGLLERLAEQVGEALALTHLDDSRERPVRYNRIVGASPAMCAVYDLMASAVATDATVLILGESGTGKEMVARAIHANGARAEGPFVKVDCTAIPETLIEAELFGHEKGAFTGADRMVKGKCELASGGTLFLDEIGDMPVALQAKLLRFVQDRELERIGGRQVIKVDVRVVAATHRDLEEAVRRGTFRKDLFYRIKVVNIALPALRERGGDDVAQLARHFLRVYARRHGRPARSIDPAAMALLRSHSWPGNIRELEHCIESAVVLCRGPVVMPAHLSLPQAGAGEEEEWAEAAGERSGSDGLTLAEVEKRHILRVLARCEGNRTKAAAALGIGRNTLARKLKQYGLADDE